MKIAVIGAGIIGVTTAYELAADGHEVVVFERRSSAAEEASFATAGLVAPGYAKPWASPGMPLSIVRQLFRQHAPVRIGLPLSGAELRWILKWYRACKLETHLSNRTHMQRLAAYSRQRLHHLTSQLKLSYDRTDGHIVLLRTEHDMQLFQPSLQVLHDSGVVFKVLNPAESLKVEPALNPDSALFGSIHLPDDEVGNCRQFALLLKNEAQRLGARFQFNTQVTHISTGQKVSVMLAENPSDHPFDAIALCAGLDSLRLLSPLGLHVPLAAIHGYSISAHIREPMNAPQSAIMDEHYKVAISRMGNRIRVAGNAEIGGHTGQKRTASLQTLYKVLHDWFPGAANLASGVQEWKGARPMLPDGPPLVSACGHRGLWLNLGHGASGWALSCGSARALADLIRGATPDLDVSGFGVERLGL